MIAEETVEQAKVVSGSSKLLKQSNLNLLESVPIIVDTVMMPTTGDQDGDDQSGGGNSSSTASPVPVT